MSSPAINKILKSLIKELKKELAEEVRAELRVSLVGDIAGIVKECLNNDELRNSVGLGWATIGDLSLKYKVSRRTVNEKCTLFKVSRKRLGRHNLVNEAEFLKAHDRPIEKPKFLNRQTNIN